MTSKEKRYRDPQLDAPCGKSPNGTHDWYALEEGLYDVNMKCSWCRKIVND